MIQEYETEFVDGLVDRIEELEKANTAISNLHGFTLAVLAEATARADVADWQPIETAPKDGSWILLTDGCRVEPAYWGNSYFNFDQAFIQYGYRSECVRPDLKTPYTHWMPLPKPPEQKS